MCCSDFSNCAERETPNQKEIIPMPGRSQPPVDWLGWGMGMGGKQAPALAPTSHSRGSDRTQIVRTFNTHTLTIQMRLNMGSAHENKRGH